MHNKNHWGYDHDLVNCPQTSCVAPERNLLAAMIARAICDAFGTASISASDKREARHWLFCELMPDHPYTFAWAMKYLDLDPVKVQQSLLNNTNNSAEEFALRFLRLKTF